MLDGKLKLTRAATDGRENLLTVLGPGEMFGELSLFDPRPRTSSASAVTDATVAALATIIVAALVGYLSVTRRDIQRPQQQEPDRIAVRDDAVGR